MTCKPGLCFTCRLAGLTGCPFKAPVAGWRLDTEETLRIVIEENEIRRAKAKAAVKLKPPHGGYPNPGTENA